MIGTVPFFSYYHVFFSFCYGRSDEEALKWSLDHCISGTVSPAPTPPLNCPIPMVRQGLASHMICGACKQSSSKIKPLSFF